MTKLSSISSSLPPSQQFSFRYYLCQRTTKKVIRHKIKSLCTHLHCKDHICFTVKMLSFFCFQKTCHLQRKRHALHVVEGIIVVVPNTSPKSNPRKQTQHILDGKNNSCIYWTQEFYQESDRCCLIQLPACYHTVIKWKTHINCV